MCIKLIVTIPIVSSGANLNMNNVIYLRKFLPVLGILGLF